MLEIKEGRSVGRTVTDGQKSHDFCDFVQLNLLHTVDNYNELRSIQYITSASTISHHVL